MTYTTIKDAWVGEQQGDGGAVVWYNGLTFPVGKVSSSSDALKDIITYNVDWSDGTTGTTTSATTTVLTDTNLTLTVNALTGFYLTYTSGPASGISEIITSNTADTITTPTFPKTPTAIGGDTFTVTQFPRVYRGATGTFTNSSDGNLSWVTWSSTS